MRDAGRGRAQISGGEYFGEFRAPFVEQIPQGASEVHGIGNASDEHPAKKGNY